MKFNPFELPLMVLNITADSIGPAELRKIVNKIIKNEIEKADGVAAANITGGRIPEVLIEIDQDKLMSKQLVLNKVVELISKSNLNYPAGTIEESFYEYLIRTIGEFQVTGEIDDLVVGLDDRNKKANLQNLGFRTRWRKRQGRHLIRGLSSLKRWLRSERPSRTRPRFLVLMIRIIYL